MRVHYQFLKVPSSSKLGCQCRGVQLVTVKGHSVKAEAADSSPAPPTFSFLLRLFGIDLDTINP